MGLFDNMPVDSNYLVLICHRNFLNNDDGLGFFIQLKPHSLKWTGQNMVSTKIHTCICYNQLFTQLNCVLPNFQKM